nr:hypothetical protein [Rhizobium anhuiense]
MRRRHRLARHDAEPCRRGFRRKPRQPHLRAAPDRPRAQPARSPATAAARPPRRAERQGAVDHRADGRQSRRAAVADRDRRRCRPLPPPDRAAVPPGDGPLAGPLLSGNPP